MGRRVLLLALLCNVITLVISASVNLKIQASNLLSNPNTLPASTHATITSDSGKVITSLIRKDNSIHFPHIESIGTHLLKIYTRDFVFASYRIDIAQGDETTMISGAWETYVGSPWTDTGVPLVPVTAAGETAIVTSVTFYPKVLVQKQFYEQRPGFSPLVLLKNPMILMGIVALGFTFGMPKLLQNMDPEMRAEYEEMQKNSPMAGISKAMQGQSTGSAGESFDLAGYLAGQGSSGTKASGRDAGNIRERRK